MQALRQAKKDRPEGRPFVPGRGTLKTRARQLNRQAA